MLIFSFRVRAGRLSFVDLFPYIDVASHVFVVSVMCIFKKVKSLQERDPLLDLPSTCTCSCSACIALGCRLLCFFRA